MKKILIVLIVLSTFFSCEKQDSLGDQGKKTENDVPFVLLSSIPDRRVADTAQVRTRFWSINDDVKNLKIEQEGFKKRDIVMNWEISYVKDSSDVTRNFKYTSDLDTVFFGPSTYLNLENNGTSFDTLYRTIENTYVYNGDWIVPDDYSLVTAKDDEIFDVLSDQTMSEIKNMLVSDMNAWDVRTIYPDADSSFFELNSENAFTGQLSSEGRTKLLDIFDKSILKSFLKSGKLEEVAGVNFKAIVTNSSGVTREDESSFDILN